MLRSILAFVSRLLCRHDYMMRFEPKRLALTCANCGHTTRGIEVRNHGR